MPDRRSAAPSNKRQLERLFRRILVAAAAPALLGGAACGSASSSGSGSGSDRIHEEYHCQPQTTTSQSSQICLEKSPEAIARARVELGMQPRAQGGAGSKEPEPCAVVCHASHRTQPDTNCTYRADADGACFADCTTEQTQYCGRRPAGLSRTRSAKAAGAGDFLAGAARLEAASVKAFERLAAELESHGAPKKLVASAKKSAEDERRHTRVTRALARRFGGEWARPTVRRPRARSLRAMAIENAVEGCLREAFGALVATHQAEHAGDARVRRAMRVIAADETAHAALAFRVGAWAGDRLDEKASRALGSSLRRAGRELVRAAGAPVAPDIVEELGMPNPRVAVAMARALCEALGVFAAPSQRPQLTKVAAAATP
jgi:hypothetical protein